MNMPLIDLTSLQLTPLERDIASRCLNKGKLRASKPKIMRIKSACGRYAFPSSPSGESAYVWRMLCFYLVPYAPHCCMPAMADCDIPHIGDFLNRPVFGTAEYETIRAAEREKRAGLDALVDKIMTVVPKSSWGGVMRWGRALGAI
jgi:hypothetical protein